MTRILVQRGSSSSSSSNPSRSSSLPGSTSAAARAEPQVNSTEVVSVVKDEESTEEMHEQVVVDELVESSNSKAVKSDDLSFHIDQNETSTDEIGDCEKVGNDDVVGQGEPMKSLSGLRTSERGIVENEDLSGDSPQNVIGSSQPPPPPVPPPKPSASNSNIRRLISGSSNTTRIGPSRRGIAWPVVSTRTSPTGSRPSSPRSHVESEGYNSADEQNSPCSLSSYDDIVSSCLSNLSSI